MRLEEAVSHLCAETGASAPHAHADQGVSLDVDGLIIALHPVDAGGGFLVHARLGRLEDGEPGVVEDLMTSNRWPCETMAGVLALDAEEGVWLVHRFAGAGLSKRQLLATLERFATRAKAWRQRLSGVRAAAAQRPSADAHLSYAAVRA